VMAGEWPPPCSRGPRSGPGLCGVVRVRFLARCFAAVLRGARCGGRLHERCPACFGGSGDALARCRCWRTPLAASTAALHCSCLQLLLAPAAAWLAGWLAAAVTLSAAAASTCWRSSCSSPAHAHVAQASGALRLPPAPPRQGLVLGPGQGAGLHRQARHYAAPAALPARRQPSGLRAMVAASMLGIMLPMGLRCAAAGAPPALAFSGCDSGLMVQQARCMLAAQAPGCCSHTPFWRACCVQPRRLLSLQRDRLLPLPPAGQRRQ
jgi:hypothetical protein